MGGAVQGLSGVNGINRLINGSTIIGRMAGDSHNVASVPVRKDPKTDPSEHPTGAREVPIKGRIKKPVFTVK